MHKTAPEKTSGTLCIEYLSDLSCASSSSDIVALSCFDPESRGPLILENLFDMARGFFSFKPEWREPLIPNNLDANGIVFDPNLHFFVTSKGDNGEAPLVF